MDGWGEGDDSTPTAMCGITRVRIMAKTGTLYTFEQDMAGAELRFNDGSRVEVGFQELPEGMLEKLAGHGWKQKVVDAAAKSRDPETGRSATDAEKIAAMKAVHERIMAGIWAAAGGGGGLGSEKMLLVRALAEFSGKGLEEAKEFINGKTKAQQSALMGNSKIKTIIDRMREQITGDVDSDELLDGFLDD
jgi:hypothetical protein